MPTTRAMTLGSPFLDSASIVVNSGRGPKRSCRGHSEREKDDPGIDGMGVLPLLTQGLPVLGTRGPIGRGRVCRLGPDEEDDEIGGDQGRGCKRKPECRAVKVPDRKGEAE